jgi:hypothetical protein
MAARLQARRQLAEQQICELDQSFASGTAFTTSQLQHNIAGVLAKLDTDSAALSRDEQAQIHRALALTEQRGTTQTQAVSAERTEAVSAEPPPEQQLDLAARIAALPSY